MNNFEKMRSEKAAALQNILRKSKSLCKKRMRTSVLDRLIDEGIIVAKALNMFYDKCARNQQVIINDLELRHKVKDLLKKVKILQEILRKFRVEIRMAWELHEKGMEIRKKHLASQRRSLQKAFEAKNIGDLKTLIEPSMEWLHSIPNTGLKKIAEEWEDNKLLLKTTDLVCKLIFLQ